MKVVKDVILNLCLLTGNMYKGFCKCKAAQLPFFLALRIIRNVQEWRNDAKHFALTEVKNNKTEAIILNSKNKSNDYNIYCIHERLNANLWVIY